MDRVWSRIVPVGVALVLGGCANYIHEVDKVSGAQVISLDAKQRAVLTSERPDTRVVRRADGTREKEFVATYRVFCTEPSPDVFSVLSQALSASGSLGRDAASANAAVQAAFGSTETGSTIPRTQTINMLRELMYRTCERYISGALDELQFPVQAVRDQHLMVSILAIEQLTGVVTPPTVMLTGTANASGAAPGGGTAPGTGAPPGSGPASASANGSANVVAGQKPDPQSVAEVARAVTEIVNQNFGQDEFELFCIRVMNQNADKPVVDTCRDYIKTAVANRTAKLENASAHLKLETEQIKSITKKIEKQNQEYFDKFWPKVVSAVNAQIADPKKLRDTVDAYIKANNPVSSWTRRLDKMSGLSSKEEVRTEFDRLKVEIQEGLSK